MFAMILFVCLLFCVVTASLGNSTFFVCLFPLVVIAVRATCLYWEDSDQMVLIVRNLRSHLPASPKRGSNVLTGGRQPCGCGPKTSKNLPHQITLTEAPVPVLGKAGKVGHGIAQIETAEPAISQI